MNTEQGIKELSEAPLAKRKAKNVLAGSINIAIKKAEQFGTPLVFKANGHIKTVKPSDLK